ncbi:MAG: SusC/RagA family TonB-linked outer membrane protein, partial [Bacteroidota bacterium]
IWSVTNEFTVGKFDISFMFQGSHGAETRNIADLEGFSLSLGANSVSSNAPRSEFLQRRVLTSDIIQDASFVSLRNLNVGYTLPANILNQFKIQSARVYVSGSNLLFFNSDDFTGWNPESVRQDTNFTAISYGYNRGGTPIVRKVVLGVNINF